MKLTVKDLFDIPIFKGFTLVAGEKGLSRSVCLTEILDFEFAKDVTVSRNSLFTEKSLVLTNLVFARDDSSRIMTAVKGLYQLNVSCMAYKTTLFSGLSQEVLDFADEKGFPILQFGGDEFFEDIILAVASRLNEGNDILSLEADMFSVIEEGSSVHEETRIRKKLNPDFRKYIRVAAVRSPVLCNEDKMADLIRKTASLGKINRKSAFCKFRDTFLIFMSQESPEEDRFKALLNDIFIGLDMDRDAVCCGLSDISLLNDAFGRAIREAYWASNVAMLEKVPLRHYRQIGIYRLIIPEIHSKNVQEYMKEYLAPLNDQQDSLLLDTACAYVLCHGDLDDTAGKLFCHKNTIRYRLSRLHQLLDPSASDKDFTESLSMAVRIHMLTEFL